MILTIYIDLQSNILLTKGDIEYFNYRSNC